MFLHSSRVVLIYANHSIFKMIIAKVIKNDINDRFKQINQLNKENFSL